MGAACACSGKERKQDNASMNDLQEEELVSRPLEFKWNNQKIFGLDDYLELEETECDAKFKNIHETEGNL